MHKVFEYTYLSIFFYYTFVDNAFTYDNRTYLEHVLCFYARHTLWKGTSLQFLTTIDQHESKQSL